MGTQLENGVLNQKNRTNENRTFPNLMYHVNKLDWGVAYRLEEKITLGDPIRIYVVLIEKEARSGSLPSISCLEHN